MNNSKEYVLITGGAGFIGSCFSTYLLARNHGVIIIDNLSTGFSENVPEGAIFIKADASDSTTFQLLDQYNISSVVHFSGQSSGEISFDDPIRDLSDNVLSTLRICDYMRKRNISKIIYASSVTAYGNSPVKFPCSEDQMNVETISGFYGIGKVASENYLRLYEQNYNLKQYSLRFQTIYGPGQNMSNLRQGMISIFLEQIVRNYNPVVVKGSLDRFRDILHIDDLVEILYLYLFNDIATGIYNVGTGIQTTFREVINYIIEETGLNPDIKETGSTKGDFFGAQADISKMIESTGYKPKISPEKGVKSYARWYFDKVHDKE